MNRQVGPALFQSFNEEHQWAEDAMRAEAKRIGRRQLDILEAGCGQRWFADLSDIDFRLTGIDLDQKALDIRMETLKDLDHGICGDLYTVDIARDSFDIVYNAFVLEHVEKPFELLERFHAWLRRDGLLILKIPDRSSAKGFATAHSPHWVHVAYYRYYKGNPNAGKPGHMPYPTPFKTVVSRTGIHNACRKLGFEVVAEMGRDSRVEDASVLYQTALRLLRFASGGNLRSDYSDLSFLLRKAA